MRKTLIALYAIVSIGFVSPTAALARGGFHGAGYRSVNWGGPWGSNYRWHGPDWWGVTGVGGYGYGYPYGYAPYYDSGCFFVRQRLWEGYGWRSRAVLGLRLTTTDKLMRRNHNAVRFGYSRIGQHRQGASRGRAVARVACCCKGTRAVVPHALSAAR